MAKIDFRRTLASYRARAGDFEILEVPERRYLMIDGHGDPNTAGSFPAALGALYPVAYALKFASKSLGRDYVVPPLEGLWWAEDHAAFTTERDPSRWEWTLMLLVPDWLGAADVAGAIEAVAARRRPARLGDVSLRPLAEGTCVQTLHVGPFSDEGSVLAAMHEEFLPSHGLRPAGTHHEIYLTDVRRTAAERRRTILRQGVTPIGRPG